MRKEIERGYFAGPKLTLNKISEFLERDDVKKYMQSRPEIKFPDLKEPNDYLIEIVEDYINSGKLNLRELSSSTNEVFGILDDYAKLPKVLVLKWNKENDYESLKNEAGITTYLDKLLGSKYKENGFSVPKPIVVKSFDGRKLQSGYEQCWIYVMRRIHGETPPKKIERGADIESDLERIVDFLALVHERVDFNSLRNIIKKIKNFNSPYYNFDYNREKINEGLKNLNIKDKEKVDEFVKDYLGFLDALVNKNKHLLVYYKDAHPRNWMMAPNKDGGRVSCIDLEFREFVLPEYDLIKLLYDYSMPELEWSKQENIISSYWKARRQYNPKVSTDDNSIRESIIRYFNLSVLRSLLSLRMIGTKRTTDQVYLLNKKAQESLSILKNNYIEEYFICHENFNDGLKKIEEALNSKKEENVNQLL